jgi:hypothetical protein
MPLYEVEVRIGIEIPGDEDAAYGLVESIMAQHHIMTGETLGWSYEMLDDCVVNKTAEADQYAPASTCRHCDRRIVDNPDDGLVDPEAEGDDIMWRETCDANYEDRIAAHEPTEG